MSNGEQCRMKYVDKVSSVFEKSHQPIIRRILRNPTPQIQATQPIFNVASKKDSHVFAIMMQLNVTSMKRGRLFSRCNPYDGKGVPHDYSHDGELYIERYDLKDTVNWWIAAAPSEKNRFIWVKDPESPAPMLFEPFNNFLPGVEQRLSTKENKEILSAAFQDFIDCYVRKDQLLVLDASALQNPVEVYNILARFLGKKVPPELNNMLVKSMPIPRIGENGCYQGEKKCTAFVNSRTKREEFILPSVCAAADYQVLANDVKFLKPELKHMEKCALDYADRLTALFPGATLPVRDIVLRYMLQPVGVRKYPTSTKIVLNIGPGSSGTRSLFMAMQQLNISGRHWDEMTRNCQMQYRGDRLTEYNANLDILRNFTEKVLFWGDNPVPEVWWKFNQIYNDRLKVIMTDMNTGKWRATRIQNSCNTTHNEYRWNGCTPPVPFSFLGNDQQLIALHQLFHLNFITEEKTGQMFDAYRDLVRCTFPPQSKQLLWLDMTKQKDSQAFWNGLLDFLELPIDPAIKNLLASSGVPYLGHTGCRIGPNITCVIPKHGTNFGPIIAPSVCDPRVPPPPTKAPTRSGKHGFLDSIKKQKVEKEKFPPKPLVEVPVADKKVPVADKKVPDRIRPEAPVKQLPQSPVVIQTPPTFAPTAMEIPILTQQEPGLETLVPPAKDPSHITIQLELDLMAVLALLFCALLAWLGCKCLRGQQQRRYNRLDS